MPLTPPPRAGPSPVLFEGEPVTPSKTPHPAPLGEEDEWVAWTSPGVYAGTGGVSTDELGIIRGDLTIHTTWAKGRAYVAVQHTGASEWFTMTGSPRPCAQQAQARELHQAAVEAVRAGNGATLPPC